MTTTMNRTTLTVLSGRSWPQDGWTWEQVRWANDWHGSEDLFVGYPTGAVSAVAVIPTVSELAIREGLVSQEFAYESRGSQCEIWVRAA